MKILFVASVYRHITAFHIPYIKHFQNQGYEVWVAGTGIEDKEILEKLKVTCLDIPFSRKPFNKENLKALKMLKELFQLQRFDLVHVHTPVASLLTRVAFRKGKQGKIIYTAHGFHFFKGAPIHNWLIYYNMEKIAARWTDHLITINNEDYFNAHKLIDPNKVSLVHGVGVYDSNENLTVKDKLQLKKNLGLNQNSIVISYIAELNENKNHHFLLRNWQQIKKENSKLELLIIGTGEKEKELKGFVKKRKLEGIHFLGYRKDVPVLLQLTDIVTLLSHREGLPKSIMEAMLKQIPCIVTNTRGLKDLIENNINGFVIEHGDDSGLIDAFIKLGYSMNLRKEMGESAYQLVEPYLLDNVIKEYSIIYEKILKPN